MGKRFGIPGVMAAVMIMTLPGMGLAELAAPAAPAPAATSTSSPPAEILQDARRLFAEHSYQLAVEKLEPLLASPGTPDDQKREALYLKGRSLAAMGQWPQAADEFRKLTESGQEDVWAGRAHWWLEPHLPPNSYANAPTSAPLEHLTIADRILSREKPEDLAEFYRMVIFGLDRIYLPADARDRRAYLFGFFDRISPLLKTDEERAEILVQKALRAGYVEGAPEPEKTLAGLEAVVSEFPKTRAAAQAQWTIADRFARSGDLVRAREELEKLIRLFPETPERRQAQETLEEIVQPQVFFSASGSYAPGNPIRFELRARNTSEVHLQAVRWDPAQWLARERDEHLDLNKVEGRVAHTERVSVERRADHQPSTATVELRLEPGAYVLKGKAGKSRCLAFVLVTDLALVTSSGSGSDLECWVVDAVTGRPRPGAEVVFAANPEQQTNLFGRQKGRKYQQISRKKTDAEGFATFRRTASHSECFAVARDGDHFALMPSMYWYSHAGGQSQVKSYIYTDRPVYRPEQKVHWRAVLREQSDGKIRSPGDGTFLVEITDPKGNRIWKDDNARLNEFGTLSGELALQPGAPLGQYQIVIRNAFHSHYSHGTFRVEEYKKPEYEVRVKAGERLVRIGETVEARVSAAYYFGAPVTDAVVRYTVRRRPHWTWWGGPGEGSDRDLGWFDRPEGERAPLHNSGGDIVATGEGRLDENGNFTLSFKAEVPDEAQRQRRGGYSGRLFDWWTPASTNTWDFQIEVTVTDKSRRNIDASQTIIVSDRALRVSARPARHVYTPGDLVNVTLRARTFNDDPVAVPGTLYVERVRWLHEAQKEEITTLTTRRVDIPASGTMITSWRIPQGTEGLLRFLLVVDDPFGGQVISHGVFTVADETTHDIHYRYQGLQIVADRDLYEVGDTARVVVLNEFPDAQAWYWISTGTGNIVKKVIPLAHRTTFLTIPITEAFVPNSQLNLVVVRDRRVIQDSKEIVVPPTRKVMTVEVTPARDTFRPGEEGEVEIVARDWQGKPVRAEFSLSVFDKSILYITPDQREDIRRAFYGTRRHVRSEIRNSLATPGSYHDFMPRNTQWMYPEHTRDTLFGNIRTRGRASFHSDGADTSYFQHTGAFRFAPTAAAAPMAMQALEKTPTRKPQSGTGALPDSTIGDVDGDIDANMELQAMAEPRLRADFRDSMFWSPAVVTDADGRARVRMTFPDSLTIWRMTAVGVDTGFLVGNATAEATVKKNLLVRLQAPRFFRERDTVTLSANVHNYLATTQTAEVRLEVVGDSGAATGGGTGGRAEARAGGGARTLVPHGDGALAPRRLVLSPGGEARADWQVDARLWGNAILRASALTPEESDAMELRLPVLPHGIDKFVAWNGTSDGGTTGATVSRSGDTVTVTQMVSVPKDRIISSTKLQVLLSPSLASCMHDAIPYLIDYPYGCVEQTMSRFMPAAIVASSLRELNFPPSPVIDRKLPAVIDQGLSRLASFQHADGGWGWWKDDETNGYMTAYVLYGLTMAREAGVAVDEHMFQRGLARLDQQVREFLEKPSAGARSRYWYFSDLHTLMYQVFVLQWNGRGVPEALETLWTRRDELTPHGLALLARTLWKSGRQEDARVVLRNMHNVAVITPENGTARWGRLRESWYWWHDAVEATAQGLLAHLEIDPQNPLAGQAMKWLVLNREGNRWKSTKDTGQAILALAAWMKSRQETLTDMTVEVRVADLPAKSFRVTPQNLWDVDMRVVLEGDAVPEGEFPVQMTVQGRGTLFYSIFADYFTTEEGITRAGNEIFVERVYEKLVRRTVTGTTGTAAVDTYVPIRDGEELKSGDELRVTLRIRSLNDYEYLVFEDPKPAGTEPVDLASGTRYGDGLCSNMELRDRHVAFFISHLPQGEWTIRYNCRAEIPGVFHTMPTTGYAMYAPPLRANSDEIVIRVKD